MDFSLQHLIDQLQQKNAQAEASLVNLQMEGLFHTSAYYNYILHKLHCLVNAGSSIPDPVSYIRDEIAKASVLYKEPMARLVSEAFNLPAIFPFVGENASPVNNQEEMSSGVENATENGRQLAQQPSGCSTGNSEPNGTPGSEVDANGPITTVAQYSLSSSNAMQSINSSQFNSHSNDGNQINMNEINMNITIGDQITPVDVEVDGGGDLEEEEERYDTVGTDEKNHSDRQESDNEDRLIDEEENGGNGSDQVEDQDNVSDVEDNDDEENDEDYLVSDEDSSDDTTDEDEQAAGPSTSTRRRSTRQVSGPLYVVTKKLKCTVPGCKKVVKSKDALNRHLLSTHKLKKYRCLVRRCHGKVSTSFATQVKLTEHLDQVHGGTTRWKCPCGKKFNSSNELSVHYWRNHELGRFACSKDGCNFKPARTRGKVLHHQRNHGEAKYECFINGCGKSFKQKCALDRHTLTHAVQRPYPCTECDKSFKRRDHLTGHLRIHRNDKCFRCTWPGCTFTSIARYAVISHIRIKHFRLPQTKKQQAEEGIEDARDPLDYLARD